jgi:exodeoxyribonuclease VII large subunit
MNPDSITITQKMYSLHDVMLSVQSVLQKSYANRFYWVRCELSRISLHGQSGHCYLELIDKNESSIVAQMRGILWADRYTVVSEKFKAVTNSPLTGGMKILIQCSVNFHPLHGLSLIISDIEPSFTLGEMARMKNESIEKLKAEGLFTLNKKSKLPLLPGRIAIVSVATSRGFHDFISTLQHHHTHYAISYELFEAILQGDNAVPTLIRAFNKISERKENFDAIAIIRGGAGDAGLACYDSYTLAAVIAQSKLPVITGIGHATNETVVEMISFKNCITPTAAATFFLEKFDVQQKAISEISDNLNAFIKSYFLSERQLISTISERFCLIVKNQLGRQHLFLTRIFSGIPTFLINFFSTSKLKIGQLIQTVLNVNKFGRQAEMTSGLKRSLQDLKQKSDIFINNKKNLIGDHATNLKDALKLIKNYNDFLGHLSEKITLLDPVNTLKRGYSITRKDGKALTTTDGLKPGIKIETQLANGNLISTIEEKK